MKLKLFILVLALQSAWLLGTAAVQEHELVSGKSSCWKRAAWIRAIFCAAISRR